MNTEFGHRRGRPPVFGAKQADRCIWTPIMIPKKTNPVSAIAAAFGT